MASLPLLLVPGAPPALPFQPPDLAGVFGPFPLDPTPVPALQFPAIPTVHTAPLRLLDGPPPEGYAWVPQDVSVPALAWIGTLPPGAPTSPLPTPPAVPGSPFLLTAGPGTPLVPQLHPLDGAPAVAVPDLSPLLPPLPPVPPMPPLAGPQFCIILAAPGWGRPTLAAELGSSSTLAAALVLVSALTDEEAC